MLGGSRRWPTRSTPASTLRAVGFDKERRLLGYCDGEASGKT